MIINSQDVAAIIMFYATSYIANYKLIVYFISKLYMQQLFNPLMSTAIIVNLAIPM